MSRVAYVNARLLDPASGLDAMGGLLTEGTRIAAVGPGLFDGGVPGDAEIVDLAGQCLAPGLIDLRVTVGEPGFEHKETIASAGRAAAAGGITALVCLPNTDPVIDDVAGITFIARKAREAKSVKIYPAAAATRGTGGRELAEMGLLAEAGAIAFTDGTRAVADAQVMARVLNYARTFGLLIMQHPEEPSLASGGLMNAGETATRLGLAGIPAIAEVMMIERDLRLVELTGARYHAAHISTAASVDAIRAAKARGLPVTCDTAPPYFALTELDVGDYRTFAKLSPPLRGDSDRRAIVAGLADGTIDAIASDHAPHDEDSKRVPFAQAAFGGAGLETSLGLALELVYNRQVPLLRILDAMSRRPAEILGLDSGRLEPGRPADLMAFDPDILWRIDAAAFTGKSKNTPFDGRPVTGRATRTVVDGRTIFTLGGDAR